MPTPRADLLVAPIIDIDFETGLLFLEGPFFTVAETAELIGPENETLDLGDIIEGDLVRVTATAGDDGEAIAQRIKVGRGFEGPIFGGVGLQLTSTFPAPGDAGVATDVIELTFNEDPRAFLSELGTIPRTGFDVDFSRDGKTVILQLLDDLADDTVYRVIVSGEEFGFFTFEFTTGDAFPTGGVSGNVVLPIDVPLNVIAFENSGVFLLDAQALLDGEEEVRVADRAGWLVRLREHPRRRVRAARFRLSGIRSR